MSQQPEKQPLPYQQPSPAYSQPNVAVVQQSTPGVQSGVYQQSGGTVQTTVVQPQARVQQSNRGLFGSIENAFNQVGHELDKALDGATHLTTYDRLRPGLIVQLQSKLNGKSLRILENGAVDCVGDSGTACQFQVMMGVSKPNTIRFRNIAQPQRYLAIIKEYLVGYGLGGSDCELIPSITVDGNFATFESADQPGSHIGALPSGQITSPMQTNKMTDASHFRVLYIVRG